MKHGVIGWTGGCTAALILISSIAWSDRLVLTNGEVVEGIIEEETAERVVLNIGMGLISFRTSRIERIDRAPGEANQDRQAAWRVQYMQVRDLPESMQPLARQFEQLTHTRNRAFEERRRARATGRRVERLQRNLRRDMERYQQVASELGGLSSQEDPAQFNQLALKHNALMSRIETGRADLRENLESIQQSVRAMLNYGRRMMRFEYQFLDQESTFRKDADEIATAWLDQTKAQLTQWGQDFAKSEVPTQHADKATLLRVMINDREPATFLLDTGASLTTLTTELARRSGVPYSETEKIPLSLADGSEVEGYPVILDSVRAGDAHAVQVAAVVLENPPREGIDGLLGMSFLNRFEMRFDGSTGNLVLRKMKGF